MGDREGWCLAVGWWCGVVHRLHPLVPGNHLLLRRWWRVLAVHNLRHIIPYHDFPLKLLLHLRILSIHKNIIPSHHLLLLVVQYMLTQASRSSCENSGTKVSGRPSATRGVSPEGRRERTWQRRLKRTTSPGPAFGDDTVWGEHNAITTTSTLKTLLFY